ncbi:MAG: hypothetical protein KKG14_12430 [Alphaproteobacteria bacterium]|nr:hypothetical protein [Alphaproteobacteria bacterium]MBU2269957.1 hypothetical protein [Alphaproteobacteria bacterium]MBU2419498.1 hypothetical protein [Alphaproteobacteria bacterium]
MVDKGGAGLDRLLRTLFWGGAAALWLLPAAAMQVVDGMDWSVSDFVVWGVMLLIAAGVCELALRASGDLAYRAGVVVAVGAGFLLVWVNLAVGIIGSEDDPANLMFFGVLAAGVIGGFAADFRARGMARALLAMAVLQGLAGATALAAGWGAGGENWPQAIYVMSGFFGGLWLLSAWLFRKAARSAAPVARADR